MFAIVDAKGMTLYTFEKNSAGKSVCNGSCAQNWPPTGPTPTTTCAEREHAKSWGWSGGL